MNIYLLIQYILLGIILCWVAYKVVMWVRKSKKTNGLSCSGCAGCALKESCKPKIEKKNCSMATPPQSREDKKDKS